MIIFAAVVASITVLTVAVNLILYNINMNRVKEYSAVINPEAVKPVLDENGEYTFVTDRELKILHLTDIHIGGGWMTFNKDRMAINAVAAMVTAEKPDLVVITGDIAYPVPFQSGTFNNKTSAKLFIALVLASFPFTNAYCVNVESPLYFTIIET